MASSVGFSSMHYMCSFTLGNFTYLYRCRMSDQYCCGHTCCFKHDQNESENVLESWYFWSLCLLVFSVFGCIVVSFALSNLKQQHDLRSWNAVAAHAFSHLATTTVVNTAITAANGTAANGQQGIIQPKLHYNRRSNRAGNDTQDVESSGSATEGSSTEGAGGLSTISGKVEEKSGEEGQKSPKGSATGPQEGDQPGEEDPRPALMEPLNPAYRSSWSGNPMELRLAASTQVFFPPGFINS